MAQSVNIAEDYSIRTLTGAVVLSRLVLTGWGAWSAGVAALDTWSDRGRLWWVFTQSSGDLSFYRRPTLGSGDKVCSGTASSGLVTLAQANSSGISGTVECTAGTLGSNPAENGTGDVIVSYANENDLLDAYNGVQSYLDSNSKWYGQNTRFEAVLRSSKRDLDEFIATRLQVGIERDNNGRRKLAAISDPRQLAKVHALYTLSQIEFHRAGANEARVVTAESYERRALALLKALEVAMDYGADGIVDNEQSASSGFVRRG